jgi:hypothetical protein
MRIERADAPLVSARERLVAVLAEIERLEGKQPPSPTLRDLLSALRSVVGKVRRVVWDCAKARPFLEKELAKWRKDLAGWEASDGAKLAEDPAQLEAARVKWTKEHPAPSDMQLKTAAELLVTIHRVLGVFEKSDSSRIPFELVRAFEQFTFELLGKEVAFLFKPTRSYDYSVLDVHRVFSSIVWEPLQRVRPQPFVVSFPAAEATSVLLHTNLYHEIAHIYYNRYINDDELERLFEARPPGVDEGVRGTFRAWIEEICCDLLALRLAGPAFLCALQFFGDPFFDERSVSETHPGLVMRRRALFKYLRQLREDYPELDRASLLFGTYCEPTDARELRVQPKIDESLVPVVREVEDFASPLWEHLFTKLGACVCPFARAGLAAAIETAVDQIGALVPPVVKPSPGSEWTTAEVLAIAFCSAWQFRVAHLSRWTRAGWSEERAQHVLSEIVLAGVEGGELELRYRTGRREKPQRGSRKEQRP